MVKQRSIASFILLGIVTFGIYPVVVLCTMGEDVNKICEGDGQKNMFYFFALLLGLVTLGIVPVIWFYKAMNRLQDNAYRYGPTVKPVYSGDQFLLWFYLGAFLLGIGPIIATAYFISDVNQFAGVYGNVQPLEYTNDQAQRAIMASNGTFANQQMQFNNGFNQIPNSVPVQNQPSNNFSMSNTSANMSVVDSSKVTNKRVTHSGVIRGIAGMYDGYDFPIENNEEISIGTNPSLASIVIDMNNQYVSPKHCVIIFDANSDSYLVNDISDFGTFSMDSGRISQGIPKQFKRGERIYLGDQQNAFRLG